jgi:hypothetical protein
MGNRYVLCRPLGGLNDMLSQIARTHSYAIENHRKLVVETQSNPKFGAALSEYFRCRADIRFISQAELEEFDSLSCFPNELTGRVSTYALRMTGVVPFREANTNTAVSFDFRKTYTEDVLIHHQPGGGLNSVRLLEELTYSDRILTELARRKKLLGPDYSAIHIRDSDYKTDWRAQLAEFAASLGTKTLFVATDNPKVIGDPCWRRLGLHVWSSAGFAQANTGFDGNEETLLDLALLAEAEELWIMKLQHSTVTYSGYSLLAKYLWSIRKIKRSGTRRFLRSLTLFTDFHDSKTSALRLLYFYLFWMPKLLVSAKKPDFLGA